MKSLLRAALLALAVPCASAAEPPALEPALNIQWTFGVRTAAPLQWRLALYPNDRIWRQRWAQAGLDEAGVQMPRPALLALDGGSGEAAALSLVGLPLSATEDGSQPTRWPLYVGGAVLALGAVWVWALDETGEALAEGLRPRPDDDGGDDGEDEDVDGGLICINGQCLLPCNPTGPFNSCDGG